MAFGIFSEIHIEKCFDIFCLKVNLRILLLVPERSDWLKTRMPWNKLYIFAILYNYLFDIYCKWYFVEIYLFSNIIISLVSMKFYYFPWKKIEKYLHSTTAPFSFNCFPDFQYILFRNVNIISKSIYWIFY